MSETIRLLLLWNSSPNGVLNLKPEKSWSFQKFSSALLVTSLSISPHFIPSSSGSVYESDTNLIRTKFDTGSVMKSPNLHPIALLLSLLVTTPSEAISQQTSVPPFLLAPNPATAASTSEESWESCLEFIQENATSYGAETISRLQSEVESGQMTWSLRIFEQSKFVRSLSSGPELGWLDIAPITFIDSAKAIEAATRLYLATGG
jgi:hypothetical protein